MFFYFPDGTIIEIPAKSPLRGNLLGEPSAPKGLEKEIDQDFNAVMTGTADGLSQRSFQSSIPRVALDAASAMGLGQESRLKFVILALNRELNRLLNREVERTAREAARLFPQDTTETQDAD